MVSIFLTLIRPPRSQPVTLIDNYRCYFSIKKEYFHSSLNQSNNCFLQKKIKMFRKYLSKQPLWNDYVNARPSKCNLK
jgi:hypothetical protein